MTNAAPPPADVSATPAGPATGQMSLWLAAFFVAAWVICLASLTWSTANPPVVNRVQVQSSRLVLLGHWTEQAAGQFHVERELVHGRLTGPVTIQGLPKGGLPRTVNWIIPVTPIGTVYTITSGQFELEATNVLGQKISWTVNVQPWCYPATDDVEHQVAEILHTPTPK